MKARISLCILSLTLLMLMTSCESMYTDEAKTNGGIVQTQTILSAGGIASFVIHPDGSLWGWGGNDSGQLGDGTTTDRYEPIRIMEDVVSVTASGLGAMAITSDGSLWSWGNSQRDTSRHTPTRIMGDVAAVSSGRPMVITSDGTLGIIGHQTDFNAIMEDVVYASAGMNHMAAIRTDGSLWVWGRMPQINIGSWGQSSDSEINNNLWNQGRVWGSGRDINRDSQDAVKIMDDVVAVSAGVDHTMAIKSDGSLWAWGYNWNGQLGTGTTINSRSPVKIMEDVVAVSAGADYSMAIRNDGSLWAWGGNWHGQLGDGTTEGRHTPVKIMDNVMAVSTSTFLITFGEGSAHTLAIKSDGSLWAWGDNTFGQLGDGTTESRLYPVMIHDGKLNP